MKREKKKRDYLKNTDHRIDIGPAGRNLFVSREKQMQDRSARRLFYFMRAILVLIALLAAAGLGIFVFAYMVPYFQEELTISGSSSESSLSEAPAFSGESIPTYDEMGLPLLDDSLCLFVINEASPVPADYEPETVEVNGVLVHKEIAGAVRLLVNDLKNEGLALNFSHGYIPFEKQEQLYEAKVKELKEKEDYSTVMARAEARRYAPPGGECDDQSALCLTVAAEQESFENSKTFSWLKTNMAKYGFVFRYPEAKESATGHVADWRVIRYVGAAHAEAMQQRSMCFEEYLGYLNSQ